VLAMKCKVLVLDEPTAGLDPGGRAAIMDQMLELNRSGMTLVMVSHSIDELARMADRIVVMSRGRIGMLGNTREIFRQYERLQELNLDVPQTAQVMRRLRDAGIPVPVDVLTVEEATEALLDVLGRTQGAGQEHNHRTVHSG